jgi:hypothetical protein
MTFGLQAWKRSFKLFHVSSFNTNHATYDDLAVPQNVQTALGFTQPTRRVSCARWPLACTPCRDKEWVELYLSFPTHNFTFTICTICTFTHLGQFDRAKLLNSDTSENQQFRNDCVTACAALLFINAHDHIYNYIALTSGLLLHIPKYRNNIWLSDW